MDIALYTCILPRLEIFYLEEWIQHYLRLGVSDIYIYNTGCTIEKIDSTKDAMASRSIYNEEIDTRVKWTKKPGGDYNTDYTDLQIESKVREIQHKYIDVVKFEPWDYKRHHKSHPYSQIDGFKHCLKNGCRNKWWLHVDPDEYIILYNHNSLPEFIVDKSPVMKFLFTQRVFNNRVRGESVRGIFNWGYDLDLCKTLAYSPVPGNRLQTGIHNIPCTSGKMSKVSVDDGMIYHYRGHPLDSGGRKHLSVLKESREIHFNKIDNRMNKYLT